MYFFAEYNPTFASVEVTLKILLCSVSETESKSGEYCLFLPQYYCISCSAETGT